MTAGAVCIVDAYSTGADLPWRFNAMGWTVCHVATTADAPELLSTFDAAHVDHLLRLSADDELGATVETLRGLGVCSVIPGTETGIEVADRLSNCLQLPGNNPRSSHLRRVKTEMQLALRDAGLDYTRGCAVNLEELFAARDTIPIPCVVKPEASAGADDVFFCESWKSIENAVREIVGTRNKIGVFNEKALIQEQLFGTQYFVNAVSVEGETRFTEIWRDGKLRTEDGRVVCDREHLLPGEGAIQTRITEYLDRVLAALDIVHGPSHTELMVNEDRIVLIETAARMQGTILPTAVESALGYSQPSAVVDATTDPARFLRTAPRCYELKRHLNVVTLISRQEGLIKRSLIHERLGELPSFAGSSTCLRRARCLVERLICSQTPEQSICLPTDMRRLKRTTHKSANGRKRTLSSSWRHRRSAFLDKRVTMNNNFGSATNVRESP